MDADEENPENLGRIAEAQHRLSSFGHVAQTDTSP